MDRSTHYSTAQRPRLLRERAAHSASVLLAEKEEGTTLVLCYRGMSGIACATALAMHFEGIGVDIGMIYVRKPGENSHGAGVEQYIPSAEKYTLVFVDDFEASGATRRATMRQVYERAMRSDAKLSEFGFLAYFGYQEGMDEETRRVDTDYLVGKARSSYDYPASFDAGYEGRYDYPVTPSFQLPPGVLNG